MDRQERLRRLMEKANSSKDNLAKLKHRPRSAPTSPPVPLPPVLEASAEVLPAAPTPTYTPPAPEEIALDEREMAAFFGLPVDGRPVEEAVAVSAPLEITPEISHEDASSFIDTLLADASTEFVADETAQENVPLQGVDHSLAEEPVPVASLSDEDLAFAFGDDASSEASDPAPLVQAPVDLPPAAPALVPEEEGPVDDIQDDVLPIVLEEAEELLPEIEALLARLFAHDRSALGELHRKVHTLKGSVAMVGAMRARAMVHSMETWMEKAQEGEVDVEAGHQRMASLFEGVKEKIAFLARGEHRMQVQRKAAPPTVFGAQPTPAVVQLPRRVHLRSDDVDRFITEINEARLANASLVSASTRTRNTLAELEEKALRLAKILRDLEIHSETQIQSRKTQIEEAGEEFDPLELDRYTHLQEISRFLVEGINDVLDLHREMVRHAAEQETVVAYQGRAIEGIQEGLQRTRLIPADAINDRLHKVVWATSRELGKPAEFYLEGGRQALDRILLEKISTPLEHILRNSIAHGIETGAERQAAGKPAVGRINMELRQEAGRVHIVVRDDGRGLDPNKIRQKAISKNIWPADRPMSMSDAADIICSAGFSTAETVSEVAGRGVGMDVVRTEVMAMGGRFEIRSTTGQGMEIAIVLPTAIASISVVLVEAGAETWAIPVEMVEHMDRLTPEKAEQAIGVDGKLSWFIGKEHVPSLRYRSLSVLMGVPAQEDANAGALLIVRTGDQRAAVLVDSLVGVAELPLRALGKQWSTVPGIMGATLLPDGRAGFLVDPLRADWAKAAGVQQAAARREKPLVMVVDDSITVRKVAERFLDRHGFDAIMAKDGQEAVEMLVDTTPDAVLLDVEMPRMDGFDCARHIRENPRFDGVPIIMITSRTADKHRQRALAMGVNAYLGKPFKEEELLPLLAPLFEKLKTAP